jgi:hypothetical protein
MTKSELKELINECIQEAELPDEIGDDNERKGGVTLI